MNSYDDKEGQFLRAKEALLSYYKSQQINQAVRLVGFILGLYAFLEIALKLSYLPFSLTIPVALVDWNFVKIIAIFLGIWFLISSILFCMARYRMYSMYSMALLLIELSQVLDIMKDSNITIHGGLQEIVWKAVKKKNQRFFLFPLNWFFTSKARIISFLASLIVFFLLW